MMASFHVEGKEVVLVVGDYWKEHMLVPEARRLRAKLDEVIKTAEQNNKPPFKQFYKP